MTPTRRLAPLLLLILPPLAGCGEGEDVNARTLHAAMRAWDQAKLEDYDLEWSTSGARVARYRVFVRGGEVRAISLVQADGSEVVAKPGDPSFFGVPGLFRTIEEELDQVDSDAPFGQPNADS